MGRPRGPNDRRRAQQPPPQQPEGNADAVAAAAIAALILAPQPLTVPVMATALLPVMPGWILALPELAADVAEGAAALTLADPPSLLPGAGELELRASLENLLLRGFYAIAAVRRLSAAVRGPSGPGQGEALEGAHGGAQAPGGAHRRQGEEPRGCEEDRPRARALRRRPLLEPWRDADALRSEARPRRRGRQELRRDARAAGIDRRVARCPAVVIVRRRAAPCGSRDAELKGGDP